MDEKKGAAYDREGRKLLHDCGQVICAKDCANYTECHEKHFGGRIDKPEEKEPIGSPVQGTFDFTY